MTIVRTRYDNVPLKRVKDREDCQARERAIQVEDTEVSEAFARYKQIRAERLEKQNLERLKEKEYLV